MIKHLYFSNIRLPKINPDGKKIIGITPKTKNSHLQYDFDNASDFLDAFDINKSELFKDNNRDIFTNYLFRGQEDFEWPLNSSICRELNIEKAVRSYFCSYGFTDEVDNFSHFVKGMDGLGLNIEKDSYDLINMIDKKERMSGINIDSTIAIFDFPKESQFKELALAQHFGVKTRLLDFTTNPLIALFFASNKAYPFSKLDKNKKIGIWIIPKLLIDAVNIEKQYIKYIDVTKYQNKYISAQKGVFLNYIPPSSQNHNNSSSVFDKNDSKRIKTLDEVLTEKHNNPYLNKLIEEHIGKPMLFTLPHNKLDIIAKRLEQLNINYFTMMPSLDGVKEEVLRHSKKPYSE